MKGRTMGMRRNNSRGFTLIAALMLTILLSGVAVGLLYMVSNEARMGGNDLEGNLAYYGAEAGIENLTSELSQLYQTSQSPNAASITALTNPANYPTAVSGSNITNMNYVECITWPPNQTCPPPATNPVGTWDIVGSGPDQGMVATLIPFTLQVTATRQAGSGQVATYASAATGASVNLTRTVEVALLPAFEFGVFCDGDCDYFAGPNFNFGGRVHTNGNLFLASGSTLTFTDKIAAVGQVITDQLENGHATSAGYTGVPYVPNAGGGCPAAPGAGPAANCLALSNGSWTGGFPPAGAANPAWTGISKSTFNGFIENGLTGAKKLQLPFVGASQVGAIDIVRRPQASDPPLLSTSRLYSKAEIRILLADTIGDLHPDRGSGTLPDGNDVQLVLPTAGGYKQLSYTGSVGTNYMYYATGTNGVNGWTTPTVAGCSSPWPLHGEVTGASVCQGAWLRVEYLNNVGTWTGVTQEWLQYGFGRPYNMPPTQPWSPGTGTPCPLYTVTPSLSSTGVMSGGPYPSGQCYNPVSPAILILQQLQLGKTVANAYESDTSNSSNTAGNWIPINFYDSREGEPRDNGTRGNNTTASSTTPVYTPCGSSGVMNAVELDTGNLWLWLQRSGPYSGGSGNLVNNTNQGGYILYFSDHRGMRADSHAPYNTYYNGMPGSSGLEDTVNSSSSAGTPSNTLEAASYYTFSPEDVNGDTSLDTQGEAFLGAGFNLGAPYISQPYFPIPANAVTASANQVNCNTNKSNVTTIYTGAGSPQNNMVTGPRHVVRLVDGGMTGTTSYLPHAASTTTYGNGFTVASEEPVYILGNYNSGPSDPFWPSGGSPAGALHSATAVIADAVTLLSNPPSGTTSPTTNVGWQDAISFLSPGDVGNRPGNTSYYRVAIAAGKSIPFPQPSWGGQDFGTDGGMHNFLRYLENRGANGATVNYTGSLISMYYSQYATGNFKCCNVVYGAPQRNYFFDTQFLNPNNLPPGTPMFQDVVSLSYHQNFTPQ